MKSILISIRPEWVAQILNGRKTIEIRKTAPKCDLPIDVYIYCTKGAPYIAYENVIDEYCIYKTIGEIGEHGRHASPTTNLIALQDDGPMTNGKVVAKFTLREVTHYINGCNVSKDSGYMFGDADREGVYEKACLSENDIDRYCPDESFCAWHISDLEIFDEPKPLAALGAESAPQSWAYIESDREPIYARKGRCEAYCDGKLIGGNYFLHITMSGSEIMHQKWAVMPTKAQAEEILDALNPEGI